LGKNSPARFGCPQEEEGALVGWAPATQHWTRKAACLCVRRKKRRGEGKEKKKEKGKIRKKKNRKLENFLNWQFLRIRKYMELV
jgi:hypothetical protein